MTKAASIHKTKAVAPLRTSSSILSKVPSLSRKNTSILSNGDDAEASGMKRKSSSAKSARDVPDLKKRKSSTRSDTAELQRKRTSTASHLNEGPSIISLSEARMLLSEQKSSSRVSRDGRALQKKLSSTKTASVRREASKPPSVVRKASSVRPKVRAGGLLKRVPVPKKVFSFDEESTPKKAARKKGKKKNEEEDERALLYLKGEFLALKSDDGKHCTSKLP